MNAIKLLQQLLLTLLVGGLPFAAVAQHTTETPDEVVSFAEDNAEFPPMSEERLDRALAAFEADEAFQRERPEWEPEPLDPADFERNEPGPIARAIAAFFEAIGSILGYLLAGLIGLAILAGLYMVFGESLAFRFRQKEKAAVPDVSIVPDLRPEAARARALLEDADALAAQGRFAEAVHLLLFRSIDEIQEKTTGLMSILKEIQRKMEEDLST